MRKLLQINSVVNSGSTGKIAENIGNIAKNEDWESYIAYGRGEGTSDSSLIRIGSRLDVYEHVLETRILDNHGFASRRATRKFTDAVISLNPDIIHLHNIHGYYINVEKLFHMLSEFTGPVVWTLHDCWSFTGHCTYFSFAGCEKWIDECHTCPQKMAYPASFFRDNSKENYFKKKELFSTLNNLHLVPVSNWLASLLEKSFLDDIPKTVIHNGIDLDVFKPVDDITGMEKLRKGKKITILGVASVWEKRKGLRDFIKLSKLIPDQYQIVVVGVSEKQKQRLPSNITGITRTNNVSELVELYTAADIFVNPTYEDNYPTTNLEAMACGTPVITYKTGGSVESIGKETGFVLEKGDVSGIKLIIDKFVNFCENKREHIASQCRIYALNHFNKNDKYREYLSLYDKLLR